MKQTAITKSANGESCTVKGIDMNEYEEKWRAIEGYEGFYEVSNLGRVRSLSKIVRANDGYKISDGKLLKPYLKNEYPRYCLCREGKEVYFHVHTLVAKAFVLGTGQVVRHLDGNPMNNHFTNLAWGSYKDNEADKKLHGTYVFGEKHHNSILNEKLVKEIRELYSRGFSQIKISRFLSINRGTIGHVVRGESWSHVV